MRIKIFLSLIIFFLSSTTQAKTLIESLSLCDSTFFNQMNKKKELKKIISVSNTNNIKTAKDVSVDINRLQDSGVTIVKYLNQYVNLDKYGEYYFWGFQLEEDFATAHETLSQYIELKKSRGLFQHNPLIKGVGDSSWQINLGATDGVAPAPSTMEKLLVLEEVNGKTNILCSIQGTVTAEDLLNIRPDLRAVINEK